MPNKSINAERVLKIISLSLFGVAVLLAFIGCFGDLFKTTESVVITGPGGMSETTVDSVAFTWLFGGMWDSVSKLKDQPIYAVMLTMNIFLLISYLIAVAGVVAILFVGLKGYFKNHDINVGKFSKFLFASVTPFLAMIMLNESLSMSMQMGEYGSIDASFAYGWGPILMIVSIFVAFAATILCKIKVGMSQNEIIHLVISKVSMLLMLIVAVISFGALFSANAVMNLGYGLLPTKISGSILFVYDFVLRTGVSKAYAIVPLISTLLMVVILPVLFLMKKPVAKIVLIASIIALAIIAGALTRQAMIKCFADASSAEIHFGSSEIACICMSAVALVLTCVNIKFASYKTPTKHISTPKA